MVGVAGKSKGCSTCRARKVKCELQRPVCGNCVRSRRICGGYERHLVFINRTSEGPQKRRYLEEVKETTLNTSAPYCDAVTSKCDLPSHWTPKLAKSFENNFLQWLHGSLVLDGTNDCTSVLGVVMSIASPGPLLEQSLLALAMSRFGKVSGDYTALQRGQILYSKSLRWFGTALMNPEISKTDDSLATACILGLYELLEIRSIEEPSGWRRHLEGVGYLLEHRGPKSYQSPVSRTIFEHCRMIFMMESIVGRRSSVFGNPVWLDIPWRGKKKVLQQKLYDYGFRLSGLIERTDSVISDEHSPLVEAETLIEDFDHLFQLLNAQHRGCHCSGVQFPVRTATMIEPRDRQPPLSPDDGNQAKLVQCILLIGLQLSSSIMTDRLRKSIQNRDGQGRIDERTESLNVQNERVRKSLSLTILRLSGAVVGFDFDPGNLIRVMWALRMAQLQLDKAYSAQCEGLLGLFNNIELLAATDQFNVEGMRMNVASYFGE